MSKSLNISVLVAARDEYIEQLKSIISPLVVQGINSIYEDAVKVQVEKKENGIIWTFQQFLKDVVTWNQTILQEESKRIKRKCPYIMDIVTAIFVSNVKILASIRLNGNSDNIKVKIPTCELFVHSVYIESAQQVFYDPMLFYHKNDPNQIQKNKRYVREIISDAVDESIRKMMPFDNILQEYLKNALDDNAEYTDSESEEEIETEGDNLNMDKVIDSEPEEPEEPEENTTKSLHINGLNDYIAQQPSQQVSEPFNPDIPFERPDTPDNDSLSYSDSSSDSDSSRSSRSSRSSSSSGSSRSSRSSRKDKHDKHDRHDRHDRHDKHDKKGKHKYSFF